MHIYAPLHEYSVGCTDTDGYGVLFVQSPLVRLPLYGPPAPREAFARGEGRRSFLMRSVKDYKRGDQQQVA